MANLEEVTRMKSNLLKIFLSDQIIVDLLRGKTGSPVPDLSMRYKNVFPYPYHDDTITEQKCFLCFEIAAPRVFSNAIKEVQISIWIFAHKELMQTASGVLTDRICERIDFLLNGSDDFGVSTLELSSYGVAGNFAKGFYGRTLSYVLKDINNWKCAEC